MYEKNIILLWETKSPLHMFGKGIVIIKLKGFMQHEYPGKICAYMPTKNRKTVMMYQYISELSDKDKEKQYIFFAYGNVICLNCGRQWKIYTIKAFATFS